MNKTDNFTLITGIIGLFADVIGLFVIFDEYRSPAVIDKPISGLLHLLILFLYIYGWFVISWIFIKRKIQKAKLYDAGEALYPFQIGCGVLLIPMVGFWLYILIGNGISNITILNVFLATIFSVALNLIIGFGILFSVLMLISALSDDW